VVGVTTSSRVKLGWEVPDDRWAEYTAKVEEKWGETRLYAGVQIEESWREYRDVHPLESYANRLLEAAGLSRETHGKNKFPSVPSLADTESSRQFVRVHEDVKHGMEQYAAANDLSKHEVLRGVIAWYLGGSTKERLIEKLERVVPEAERAFTQVTDNDSDTVDNLDHTERLTREIARSLGDRFYENDLKKVINAKTSGTNHFHRVYTPRVAEYKGVKRWENDDSPDIFLPLETWKSKQTRLIVSHLGGDMYNPPPAFTINEFAQAAENAGIEAKMENWETVNEYRVRVLKYIKFTWSDETEQFEPVDDWDAEVHLNLNTAEPNNGEIGYLDPSVDTDSITVSDQISKVEESTMFRTDGG